MKAKFQIPALLFAFAAMSAAPASAQLDDMIAWNNEQLESSAPSIKEAILLKTIFLDNHFNQTSVSQAAYYQTVQPIGANLFLIKSYFVNGDLKMVGTAKNTNDLINHGEFVYYYQSGAVESRGKFSNGVKDGIWQRFAPDGRVKSERIYTGKPVEHYFETPAFKVNYQTPDAMNRGLANQPQ